MSFHLSRPGFVFENRSLIKYRLIIDEFGPWSMFQDLLRVHQMTDLLVNGPLPRHPLLPVPALGDLLQQLFEERGGSRQAAQCAFDGGIHRRRHRGT